MKRFTEKRWERNTIPLRKAVCGVDMPTWSIGRPNDLEMFLSGEAADRLAAYEDTGFEPEEVAQMGNALKLQSAMVNEAKRYWLLQDQGRLILLPCKVGDTLYAPTRNIVSEFRVSHFEYGGYQKPSLWVNWYLTKGFTGNFRLDGIGADQIGKTVFLTREEAEAALEAKNGTTDI